MHILLIFLADSHRSYLNCLPTLLVRPILIVDIRVKLLI